MDKEPKSTKFSIKQERSPYFQKKLPELYIYIYIFYPNATAYFNYLLFNRLYFAKGFLFNFRNSIPSPEMVVEPIIFHITL